MMEAIKRKCRPKHQVLILKCYPRITKGAVDIKPNSSELSYLLFYATSRRSKIQKIGAFLEKRTAHDVWRQRVGNVQVTLQILAAVIEKCPKDLPLIAPCVLRVFDIILDSKDIVMCESSVPTFQAFCEHHDATSLNADQGYLDQYIGIVEKYTTLASATLASAVASAPVQMRWKHLGLEAIKCLVSSDNMSSSQARQIDTIVPVILENLWTDNDEFIDALVTRVGVEEKEDTDRLSRRRPSIATVRTGEQTQESNPAVAAGTAVDVDRLAEEDIGVLALQCLKLIYVVPNRQQIRDATLALFRFIDMRVSAKEVVNPDSYKHKDTGWAIRLFNLVARWATVQDRYTIVITAMDTLGRAALKNENLDHKFALVCMITSLLRSDVNLIGLSVMDVLVGLISFLKRVVRLPDSVPNTSDDPAVRTVTQKKRELLEKVQICIGGLATHIYYGDQISDMVMALLLQLKPIRSSTHNSSPNNEGEEHAVENGAANGKQGSANDLSGDGHALETYILSNQGRIAILKAIKEAFLVANPQARMASNKSLTRNKVPINVWEGTHWLLRDPDGQVRKAYVDSFCAWLDRETTAADSRAHDDSFWQRNSLMKSPGPSYGRRAVSTMLTPRDTQLASNGSRFLQMIHLVVYDNALQYVDFETDYLLLHVLLSKMVLRLGVNAIRFGLPMVFRLQEDILEVDPPVHKVRIGCLCHGYFWAVTEKFGIQNSVVGQAIGNEVSRRRSKHFWIEGLNVPPSAVELFGTPGLSRPQPRMPLEEIEFEALLPFDDRLTLVEVMAHSYENSWKTFQTGQTSPNRDSTMSTSKDYMGSDPLSDEDRELPLPIREQLLSEWTRELALITVQSSSKSISLNGSRTGGSAKHRILINGNGRPPSSPRGSRHTARPASSNGTNGGLMSGKQCKNSVRSTSRARSASSRGYVASVDQLKQILTGQPVTAVASRADKTEDDDASESMVSFELTPSEASYNPMGFSQNENADDYLSKTTFARSASRSSRRSVGSGVAPSLTMHPTRLVTNSDSPRRSVDEASNLKMFAEVPPVPSLLKIGNGTVDYDVMRSSSTGSHKARKALRSRGGTIGADNQHGGKPSGTMNLQDLLSHIDSRTGELSFGGATRPPY